MEFLIVGLGGFFGAVARYALYLVERTLNLTSFPFATLFINVSGCVFAGFLMALAGREGALGRTSLLFATVGFTGAFTTFSTFGVDTFQLFRSGAYVLALSNVFANLVLGLLGVIAGFYFTTLES